MQTYSHFLLTWALEKPLRKIREKTNLPPVRKSALLIGSIAPDALLIGISVVLGIIDVGKGDLGGKESLLHTLFSDWFFRDLWIIVAQNTFHSPLVLSGLIAIGLILWRQTKKSGGWLVWFSSAAMLHTLIDIPLHHDDGPLVFFPINWTYRFQGSVSYWDPNHFGREFFLFEHLLVVLLILILVRQKMRNSSRKSRKETESP